MSILEHRKAIDRIDRQLVRLLNERVRHAREIGALKKQHGEEIYAPHRERAVLERICRLNPGPLPEENLRAIYREITSVRAQIESLKGRQQYLERMTAMATINLEIRPKEAPRAVVTKAKWNPLVTLTKALRGFVEVMQVLAESKTNLHKEHFGACLGANPTPGIGKNFEHLRYSDELPKGNRNDFAGRCF